jgi:hypothetical protein
MSAAGPAEDSQRDRGAGGAAKDERQISSAEKADGKGDQCSHARADHGNHDSLGHHLMLADGHGESHLRPQFDSTENTPSQSLACMAAIIRHTLKVVALGGATLCTSVAAVAKLRTREVKQQRRSSKDHAPRGMQEESEEQV